MSEERDHILKMVEDGAISATEAADLLASIEDDVEDGLTSDESPLAMSGDKPWEAPVIAGAVLSGFGLLGLMRSRKAGVLGRVGAWATLLLGIGAMAIGLLSRNAPWLHVRVRDQEGKSIDIQLPLPLPFAAQILGMVRGFVDAETAAHVDSALAFIDGLQRGEQQDPLSIEVDDGEGNLVQVTIG